MTATASTSLDEYREQARAWLAEHLEPKPAGADAAATAASEAVADARPTASEIVSIAKAYVGDAGTQLAQQCLQVHGGIGFTWEHDLHFYLRRLATDRALYGDPEWHRERICRIHGL